MEADPTTPLLRSTVPAAAGHPPAVRPVSPPPLSRLQRYAITFFSVARILRGLSFMVYPAFILSSFDISRSGGTFLLGSLLGSRDILIGALLYTADCAPGDDRSRRELRRALLANLLSDALDTFILIFSAAAMWHWRNPFIEIGCVATLAVFEHLTLWSMSDADDDREGGSRGYQAMVQANEDKQTRLDTWLQELRQVEETRAASPMAQNTTA